MDETADIPPDPREVSVRFSVDPRFEEPKDLNFERKREVLDRAGGRIENRRFQRSTVQDSQRIAERAPVSEVSGWSLANVPARPSKSDGSELSDLHLAKWLLGNGSGESWDPCLEETGNGANAQVCIARDSISKRDRDLDRNAIGAKRFGSKAQRLENVRT